MSNPNMENKVKELLELKRMKEELEAEIATMRKGRAVGALPFLTVLGKIVICVG